MLLHLTLFPPGRYVDVTPYIAGASLCGLVAGWRILGLGLGRGTSGAAILALTAAGAGAVMLCVMAGAKAVVDVYAYGSFSTVMKLLDYLTTRAAEAALAALDSPGLMAAGLAAPLVGAMAELVHRTLDRPRIGEG
jgi:hypothetical protein